MSAQTYRSQIGGVLQCNYVNINGSEHRCAGQTGGTLLVDLQSGCEIRSCRYENDELYVDTGFRLTILLAMMELPPSKKG